jgi:hypothetical protein
MVDSTTIRGVIPYVFCVDAGAVAEWPASPFLLGSHSRVVVKYRHPEADTR